MWRVDKRIKTQWIKVLLFCLSPPKTLKQKNENKGICIEPHSFHFVCNFSAFFRILLIELYSIVSPYRTHNIIYISSSIFIPLQRKKLKRRWMKEKRMLFCCAVLWRNFVRVEYRHRISSHWILRLPTTVDDCTCYIY